MNATDLVNSVNGSLNSIAVLLLVLGALEIQKGEFIGGGILLVAGFVSRILYEMAPDKPTTPPTVTTP